jgi:hypothetical protein
VVNPTNTGTRGTFGSGWSGSATGMHVAGNGTGGVVSIIAADGGDQIKCPGCEYPKLDGRLEIAITLTGAGRTLNDGPETLEQLIQVRWTGPESRLDRMDSSLRALKLTQVQTIGWLHGEALTEEATLRQKFYRQKHGRLSTNYIYVGCGATASGSMGHFEFRCCSVRG